MAREGISVQGRSSEDRVLYWWGSGVLSVQVPAQEPWPDKSCQDAGTGGKPMQKMAFKYDVEVKEEGKVELSVPLPPGVRVTVFVIKESDEKFVDLTSSAQSSLDFWDNPLDDEDWNSA